MPTKGKRTQSQVKGNGIKPGIAGPSALTGRDTNKWDVTGQAKQMAEAAMDRAEPFIQAPMKGHDESFPTIYGVDLKEKRRQKILKDISSGGGQHELGKRQVMLDDKTVDWIIREQDRVYLIERDLIFENSAKNQGLFNNPAGLEYLHKINPGYFSRRRKMAKWLVKTQLKLFDIAMDGVANESDFDFMLMIQSLPRESLRLLELPVHKLTELRPDNNAGLYQKGALRKARLPMTGTEREDVSEVNRVVPFAGATNNNWHPSAMDPQRNAGRGLQDTIYGQNFDLVLSNARGKGGLAGFLGYLGI
jgi:hypothetical protein